MDIKATFKNIFQRKSRAIISPELWAAILNGGTVPEHGIPTDYTSLSLMAFMANPDAFACIDRISKAAAGINWVVRKKRTDGTTEKIPAHPLLDLFNRPNPNMSRSRFIQDVISYRFIGGDCFILKNGPGLNMPERIAAKPRELWPIRPDTSVMQKVKGKRLGEIEKYVYRSSGQVTDYPPEMVLDLPCFNPIDDLRGLSPLAVASLGVGIGNEGRLWNYSLLKNSARPPGGFFSDQSLSDAQYERLKAQVEEKFMGSRNAGKPFLGDGGLKWQSMALTPADMDWKGQMRMSTIDVCRVFNVAPELIGDSENKTYSNYKEARESLYHEAVLPLMDYLCDEFNQWLSPMYGDGVILDYDRDDIEALQEDRDKIWKRATDGIDRAILTPAQAAIMLGLEVPTDPLAQKLYISRNLVPLETAGVAQELPAVQSSSKSMSHKDGCGCLECKGILPPMDAEEKALYGVIEPLLGAQVDEVMKNIDKHVGE
jgi:HK97 family phage portal protein